MHRSLELQCVTGEYIDADLGGEKIRVNHGEVLLIASGMPHALADGGENYAMLIPPRYLDAWFQAIGETYPKDPVVRGDAAARMIELVLAIKRYFTESPVKLLLKVYEILDIFIDNLEFVGTSKPSIKRESYDIISKCMQYIDDNYTKVNITLGALAGEFGYNKNYLSELLHRELGMNFRDFINQRRLELLVTYYDRDRSFDEQAEKYGFSSRQTFYRAFKKQYGMTPAEYFDLREGGGTPNRKKQR